MKSKHYLAAAALLCLSCVSKPTPNGSPSSPPAFGSVQPAAGPTATADAATPSAFVPNQIPEAARAMITSIHTGARGANESTATRTLTKDVEALRKSLVAKGLDPSIVDGQAKAYVYLEEPSKGRADYRLRLDALVLAGTTAELSLTLVDTSVDGFFTPFQSSPWMLINFSGDPATTLTVNVK